MTETAVRVENLKQWKSVLDVWFEQGYSWYSGDQTHMKNYFKDGERELLLDKDNDILIPTSGKREPITYSEFMAQQKEDNKMSMVYEVSQSVFDELQRIKAHEGTSLIGAIVAHAPFIKFIEVGNKAILRYLADDPAIEFKVKEPLYRLWRVDDTGTKSYMKFVLGTPDWTVSETRAFTAPLEEIEKWNNPAWEIEKVQHGK
ncbi:MAG: hypothetical protein [Bacteriophage sp.]|nr:MAG: hypothetical protein [Bacteriophage sp.]